MPRGVYQRQLTSKSRPYIKCTEHPRANNRGFVPECILFAEAALGKLLPPGAIVHHVDENPRNNCGNLVLCQDQAYHLLLHTRRRALLACGNADWKKCSFCKEYDDPQNMVLWPGTTSMVHTVCRKRYAKIWSCKVLICR